MSQHIEDENVEAFKAKITDLEKRIVELDGENQRLRQTLAEASKTLMIEKWNSFKILAKLGVSSCEGEVWTTRRLQRRMVKA